MKIRKTLVGLTVSVLSAISIAQVLNIYKAEAEVVTAPNSEQAVCRKFFAGTYLTTISDSTGQFASRAIITLTIDGNIVVTDSNQGGVYQGENQFNPFTTSQGSWKCNNGKVIATTLDFNLSGPLPLASNPLAIAGQRYRISFNQSTQTLQGTIELRFFDLNATVQEATGSAGVPLTFTFTGQRVPAK